MKAAPVIATAFGFVKVIFSTEVALVETEAGVKAFRTVTRLSTTSVPLTDELVPAFVVVTAPVLLT